MASFSSVGSASLWSVADSAHFTRFSIEGDSRGIAGQRAAHFSIYSSSSPAISRIAAIPEDAWDPRRPDLGMRHGITWITMSDLHHSATGSDPIAAYVAVDDVVFFSITLSSTLKHIKRVDAEDLNGTTALVTAVINAFPSLGEMCWADDVTRANRDHADWAAITTKAKIRDIAMVFGGQRYSPSNNGDMLALGALGLVGGNDDPMRRRKLTGKRLMKYKLGGAAIAESQMPHGWQHAKDKHGRAIDEGDRGLIPEADPEMVPVLQALYCAHATGASYQDIARRMEAFEATGLLRRRDHTDPANTYARAADDPLARYDAAKHLFVRSSFRPETAPSEEAIARYLDGTDPAEVFDTDARLYIAKVELVRTGRYYRRLKNDIRGRNIVLDGIAATYRDDLDEYGHFVVMSAPWAWPRGDDGQDIPRFGITDEVCRKVAARLLRELRAPRASTGGQAHRTPTRRALQSFTNWTVLPGDPGSAYDDEPTQWGVQARANNSGRSNFVVLFRRQSAGASQRGGRGWSYFGAGESKPAHIHATGSLGELCASVAVRLDTAVRRLADPASISTLAQAPLTENTGALQAAATRRRRLNRARSDRDQVEAEARGLRTMAAMAAADGEEEEAREYATMARDARDRLATAEAKLAKLEAKADGLQDAELDSPRLEQTDVSIAAYLVAGLEDASRNNGHASTRLGQMCDQTLTGWRFTAVDGDLTWSCTALLPLREGGHVEVPLTGTISNVRPRVGKDMATTETAVRYVFEEGRDLDGVAALLQVSRKGLLTRRIMPWLVSVGVTSRGAKCALVDHPLPGVRRMVHAHLNHDGFGPAEPSTPYRDLILATYLDPMTSWGDAATPDDTVWIRAALQLLTSDIKVLRRGLTVAALARALGRSEADVAALASPRPRPGGGFTRPRYLERAGSSGQRVRAIGCPHEDCATSAVASHVVLLPEVAASGFGVLCPRCRRAPRPEPRWSQMIFPDEYLTSWTTRGEGGLREQSKTVLAA